MPQEITISVENIKCGGCATTISNALNSIAGVSGIEVDVQKGLLRIENEGVDKSILTDRLAKLGYPERSSSEGIKAAQAKETFVAACAIGRASQTKDP